MVKYVDYLDVWEKRYFFSIKCSKKNWRQVVVKCSSLADSEYKLYKRLVDIGTVSFLCFSPKQVFWFKQAIVRFNCNSKINVPKDMS